MDPKTNNRDSDDDSDNSSRYCNGRNNNTNPTHPRPTNRMGMFRNPNWGAGLYSSTSASSSISAPALRPNNNFPRLFDRGETNSMSSSSHSQRETAAVVGGNFGGVGSSTPVAPSARSLSLAGVPPSQPREMNRITTSHSVSLPVLFLTHARQLASSTQKLTHGRLLDLLCASYSLGNSPSNMHPVQGTSTGSSDVSDSANTAGGNPAGRSRSLGCGLASLTALLAKPNIPGVPTTSQVATPNDTRRVSPLTGETHLTLNQQQSPYQQSSNNQEQPRIELQPLLNQQQPRRPPTDQHLSNFESLRDRSGFDTQQQQVVNSNAVQNNATELTLNGMVRGNAGSWRTRVPSSDGTGSSSAVAAQGSTGIPNIPQRTSAYRPTKMWSNQNNDDANRAAVRPRRNTNYRGDPNSEYFTQHVIGLEDEANSALWIMDIPTSVKATDLFSIVHVGAVSYLNLHKPETEDGKCAADLAFKQPEHAARFYSQIKSGLFLHGGQLWGRYNRNGLLGHNGPQRRVIWIRAPEDIMTEEYWRGYFDLYCVNRVVGVRSEPVVKGQKLMEFEFVRIAGQAQSCLQAILNDEELIEKGVSAGYSRDPCEA